MPEGRGLRDLIFDEDDLIDPLDKQENQLSLIN
jgi:hypothetical protein